MYRVLNAHDKYTSKSLAQKAVFHHFIFFSLALLWLIMIKGFVKQSSKNLSSCCRHIGYRMWMRLNLIFSRLQYQSYAAPHGKMLHLNYPSVLDTARPQNKVWTKKKKKLQFFPINIPALKLFSCISFFSCDSMPQRKKKNYTVKCEHNPLNRRKPTLRCCILFCQSRGLRCKKQSTIKRCFILIFALFFFFIFTQTHPTKKAYIFPIVNKSFNNIKW